MADQSLFNKEEKTVPPQNDQELIDSLVGEGKAYKTLGDLAKGKLNGDIHIKQVELENKELRERVASAKTVEDVLAAVQAKVTTEGDTSDEDDSGHSAPVSITPEQVAKIVAEQITGRETSQKKAINREKVNKMMFELFGDASENLFLKEANTPELQKAFTQLAEIDPDKFMGFFKKESVKTMGVDSGGKNINALNISTDSGAPVPGTQKFYSHLRKTNPTSYYSAGVQVQMHQDAMSNPGKYFGRS